MILILLTQDEISLHHLRALKMQSCKERVWKLCILVGIALFQSSCFQVR
jgi:hypothetical protein